LQNARPGKIKSINIESPSKEHPEYKFETIWRQPNLRLHHLTTGAETKSIPAESAIPTLRKLI